MFSLGSEVLIFGTYEHPFRMMKTFTTWERRKKWRRNEIKNIIPRAMAQVDHQLSSRNRKTELR